jgi:HD superfamily phosphodiesterase
MQNLLIDFNSVRKEKGLAPVEIGIGLNRGKAIAGNIGSKDQMNYTVIGDAVNVSARLCSHAEAGQILVSESVVKEVELSGLYVFEGLDPIKVKGKAQALPIFALQGCIASKRVIGVYDRVVGGLLRDLSKDLLYHCLGHTLDVFRQAYRLALAEKCTPTEVELVLVAALFHDTGFLVNAEGHEEESCRLATQYLPELGFNSDELNQVSGMIRATKIPQKPLTRLEEILADADLDYLGRSDFDAISMTLFEELKIRGIVHDLQKWDQIQLTFLGQHQYFTDTAQKERSEQKMKHIERIKQRNIK